MRITDRTVEAVRASATFGDVMDLNTLKRKGRNYAVPCPWGKHNDPNKLEIDESRNQAKCWSCDQSVDPIGWLTDVQGRTFTEAIEELARKRGIPVDYDGDPDKYRQHQQTVADQRRQLEQGFSAWAKALREEDRTYLRSRGLADDTIAAWEIGVGRTAVDARALRLQVPIRDHRGKACGYTARKLEARGNPGKWVNGYGPPKNPLFEKSKILFGMHRAWDAIRKTRHAIVTEGAMDVILCHQAGLDQTVAVCGTAVTADHVALLLRAGAERVTLCLDWDQAGQNKNAAALRVLMDAINTAKVQVDVLVGIEGEDPASLWDAMPAMVADAKSWDDWLWEHRIMAMPADTSSEKARREAAVRKLLSELPDGKFRDHLLFCAARDLDYNGKTKPAPPVTTKAQRDACEDHCTKLLRVMVHCPDQLDRFDDQFREWMPPAHQTLFDELRMLQACNAADLRAGLLTILDFIEDPEAQLLAQRVVAPRTDVLEILRRQPVEEFDTAVQYLIENCSCEGSYLDHDR